MQAMPFMIKNTIINRLFGTKNDRTLRRIGSDLLKINALESVYSDLSQDELSLASSELRAKAIALGDTESLLCEAYALCREMSSRILGMRHYDVQIIGGLVLNEGNIAEMRTGEGKTLVATLPAYLNSLDGRQVHIVTVNDYLAKRDALLMKPLYEALGLKVGFLQSGMKGDERKKIYGDCHLVYGTNSEFAFDFLRDNIATSSDNLLQRKLAYVLIDEVDSILIDEARTPLIISGEGDINLSELDLLQDIVSTTKCKKVVEYDKDSSSEYLGYDAVLSIKNKGVHLTEQGFKQLEDGLISKGTIKEKEELYTQALLPLVDLYATMLRANNLFEKNKDYVVIDGKVQIVNQNTGRIELGRRWSDGLHQAMEAKEGVQVLADNKSLASISLQNFFRLYEKISGMTGTADTDAYELMEVYGLDVVVIPTHRPLIRDDQADRIFAKQGDKLQAVIDEIAKMHKRGRPVLVGTTSIEESENISERLKQIGDDQGYTSGLPHSVLNAKNHEHEASIVAMAGRPGAITIATNMAGRGTDIILGGNPKEIVKSLVLEDELSAQAIKRSCEVAAKEVAESGGLHVIGTSRNYSRRIDNQLIGRAGRQGDPGSSVFFVSLEDDFMKIFGGQRFTGLFNTLGLGNGESITHPFVNKAIRDAQGKIEKHHYAVRKDLLKYDDINNMQRKEVYTMRKDWLLSDDIADKSASFVAGSVEAMVDAFAPDGASFEDIDYKHIELSIEHHWGIKNNFSSFANKNTFNKEELQKYILELAMNEISRIISEVGLETYCSITRQVMIDIIDRHWIEQISMLDNLRAGIHLRGYAQKNPIQEYSLESLAMFKNMIELMKPEYLTNLFVFSNQSIEFIASMNRDVSPALESV